MKARIIVMVLVTVAGLNGCAGRSARHSSATTTTTAPTAAPTADPSIDPTRPTVDPAPTTGTTTPAADGCRPTDGNPCPGDRRDLADGTVPDPPDPSGETTTTAAGPPAVRCRANEQVVASEEALIALTTTQLDRVKADPAIPAEAKRILVARYQQMLDDARSLRDAYVRDGCRG